MASSEVPDFIVHDREDSVGVVVVEGIKAGDDMTGWIMDGDETVVVKSLDAIPLGHKVAMRDHNEGDTVIKYGHDIGVIVNAVKTGGHLHVHNSKTKRW